MLFISVLMIFLLFANGRVSTSTAESMTEATTEPIAVTATPRPAVTPVEVIIPLVEPTPAPTVTLEPTDEPTSSPVPTPEPSPSAAQTPTPEPTVIREDLSKKCSYSTTNKYNSSAPFTDNRLKSSIILADQTSMTYRWKANVPASMLYLFCFVMPDAFHVSQWDEAGNVLMSEDVKPERMCLQVPLQEGCRKVTVTCLGRCKINAFQVFGPGNTYPKQVVWWTEDYQDHCDLMLFSTHFDDEILMMGGVLPIYAGEQRKDCQVVYMKGTNQIRKLEAIQGLWEMGVRREAIYLSCTSKSLQKALDNDAAGVFAEDNLQQLVNLLRRYRPLVVVTHDVNGEYGHESHKKTSALVRRAVELSADPAYDPDSVAKYGVWQVQKEYIHLWKENPLELDISTPLKNMGNRSAYEVAAKAFTYHKTQQGWSITHTHHNFPIGNYGLYFTAVGPDSGLNDMFENVTTP